VYGDNWFQSVRYEIQTEQLIFSDVGMFYPKLSSQALLISFVPKILLINLEATIGIAISLIHCFGSRLDPDSTGSVIPLQQANWPPKK
jgi:hypothetical protein